MRKVPIALFVSCLLIGCVPNISSKLIYEEEGSKAYLNKSEKFSLGGLSGEIGSVTYEVNSEDFGKEKQNGTILTVNASPAHLVTVSKDEKPNSYKVSIGKKIGSNYQINTHDLNGDGEFDTLTISRISENGDEIELTDMNLDGQFDMQRNLTKTSKNKLPEIWVRNAWRQWERDDSGSYVLIDSKKVYVEMDKHRVFQERHD